MSVSLIVAMGRNRVIGADQRMPWHLSADLKRFKAITLGKPIIMGRRTHESIGRPLPGRLNIVLSRETSYRAEGCSVVHDLESALQMAAGSEEVMVIGGAALYAAALPVATRIYLTEIHREFPGDTFFPEFERCGWTEMGREDVNDDPQVDFSYSFTTLRRTGV